MGSDGAPLWGLDVLRVAWRASPALKWAQSGLKQNGLINNVSGAEKGNKEFCTSL